MPRAIQRSSTTDGNNIPVTSPSATGHNDYFTLRGRRPSIGQVTTPDDFSGWSGPGSHKSGSIAINTQATSPNAEVPPTPSTPSGHGLMNRLRAFGKVAKRQASEIGTASTSPALPGLDSNMPPDVSSILAILRVLSDRPLGGFGRYSSKDASAGNALTSSNAANVDRCTPSHAPVPYVCHDNTRVCIRLDDYVPEFCERYRPRRQHTWRGHASLVIGIFIDE